MAGTISMRLGTIGKIGSGLVGDEICHPPSIGLLSTGLLMVPFPRVIQEYTTI